MSDDPDFDHGEAFLAVNATREYIAHQMADVLRELLRATVSEEGSAFRAAEKMDFAAKLLQRCKDPLTWWNLFDDAVAILRANASDHQSSDGSFWAAREGMRLFIEYTADDSFAAARLSQRRNDFERSIRKQ